MNDYLARRDAEWMGRLYRFLGLTVGVVVHERHRPASGRKRTAADITYGQNNEFGFDYLRDNMKFRPQGLRAARAALRHRRRGGLHPHRRGAHAARSSAARGGEHRQVLQGQPGHPRPGPRPRLHRGREGPLGRAHRGRRGEGAKRARASPTSTTPANRDPAPREAGVARAHALQARPRVRGEGRRGDHRRRVHRPPDARAPLVATACTRPWKRRKASRSRTRTRRWPRSRSRTTSACTRSSPA